MLPASKLIIQTELTVLPASKLINRVIQWPSTTDFPATILIKVSSSVLSELVFESAEKDVLRYHFRTKLCFSPDIMLDGLVTHIKGTDIGGIKS